MPTSRSSTMSIRPTPWAPARRFISWIACSGVTGMPSSATGTPWAKVITISSASGGKVGSSVYVSTSLVGAFQMSSRKPVSTARPHTFWSIENGLCLVVSIDQNVWGRAVETGFLVDIWNAPTKDVYTYTDDPTSPPVADEVVITFAQGVPVALDGIPVTPLQAIQEMNRRAGAQGVG